MGTVRVDRIPEELKARIGWIVWRTELRRNKPTKVPYIADDLTRRASSTDPSTWRPFSTALTTYLAGGVDGIGLMLGDGLVGLDLDHCMDPVTGALQPGAREIVDVFDSYSEYSPSKTGVHVWVRGQLPPGRRRKGPVEMYDRGRYFTVTGDQVPGTPSSVEERTEQVQQVHGKVFGARSERTTSKTSRNPESGTPPSSDLSDDKVISRATSGEDGAKFRALWQGDHSAYPSQSEADFALCCLLAFWTGPDAARIDRLFRRSGLYRDKWDDQHGADGRTYGQLTIEAAFERTAAGMSGNGCDPTRSPLDRTDIGNAAFFARVYSDVLRFDHRQGRWLIWQPNLWWEEDRSLRVVELAKEAVRERHRQAVEISAEDERKRQIAWALASASQKKLTAMQMLARSEAPVSDPGESWDRDPWLLGVANGVVDLRTGELRPGRKEDRVTLVSRVAFDPQADCPRWRRFQEEIFDGEHDLIGFVHRALGYSVTGLTSEQVLFVCYGTGANGKGTLFHVVSHVLGGYGANVPFSTLEFQSRAQIPNDIAMLVGKRFVTASECDEAARLNEARVKALTGCDPITARFLHREFFTFHPVAKFWLGVNHKPIVRDTSYGFWRRICLVPFNRQFPVDQTLESILIAEAPGILRWLVEGCLLWRRIGLSVPETVRGATRLYQDESDLLSDFLRDCCDVEPEAVERAGRLHKAYGDWCDRQGITAKSGDRLGQRTFGQRMAERFAREHDRNGWFYTGVRLREEPDRASFVDPVEDV